MTMKMRKENILIIFDRFSAVFVQNPTILSDTETRLGSVTAPIQRSIVGNVSIRIPAYNAKQINT